MPLRCLAQRPRPDRPYRGLFGGNGANPASTQQLDVNLSLFGAYDDNVLATTPQGTPDPRFQQSGGYGSGTISLDYTKRAGRATFDFSGGTGYRYYRTAEELNGFNSFLSIGMSAQLTSKTDLRLSATGNYTPYYSFTPVAGIRPPAPGDIVPNNPDNPLAEERTFNVSSSASVTQRLTPRSSLSADYNINYTDYSNRDLPYQNWAAGGGLQLPPEHARRLHLDLPLSPRRLGAVPGERADRHAGHPVWSHVCQTAVAVSDDDSAASASARPSIGATFRRRRPTRPARR